MSKVIKEINTPFKALLATLNGLLQVLNKLGYKIHDPGNPNYYVLGIAYNNEEDRLQIIWGEDE